MVRVTFVSPTLLGLRSISISKKQASLPFLFRSLRGCCVVALPHKMGCIDPGDSMQYIADTIAGPHPLCSFFSSCDFAHSNPGTIRKLRLASVMPLSAIDGQ